MKSSSINTKKLVTKNDVINGLKEIGVQEGGTLLVHSSLSSLGWVCGGAITIIESLIDVVGDNGTIVMPTHSTDLSNPKQWENPPVPQEWRPTIIEEMPAFDPRITPTCGMGKVPELFRNYPGVVRSSHPQYSFAALGKQAQYITGQHPLDFGLGRNSPLQHLYDLNADVLLLGVSYINNTSFHLAEHFVERAIITEESPIQINGKRKWVSYQNIEFDPHDEFESLGKDFEQHGDVKTIFIGNALCRLFKLKTCVDYAIHWFAAGQGKHDQQ